MSAQTIEDQKASMRRRFKAWEICSYHLEDIKAASDEEAALWAVLRSYENDKFQRFMLWVDVVSAAAHYWDYEFECIREQT